MTNDYRIARPPDSTHLAREVIATMWREVNFHEGPTALKQTLRGATPGQRAVYACTWYVSEVSNGGHWQFFFNATGALWREAVAGFELLGARDYEENLRMAVTRFGPAGPSRDPGERQDQVDALPSGAFAAFDHDLFALERQRPLDAIFRAYIDAHPDEFFR